MDADAFRERVETDKGTQLNRLGSNKLLIALTDAELDEPSVLRAAAHSEYAAENTFSAWAADEDDADARAAFERTADREAEHFERVVAELNGAFDPSDGGPMHSYLRGLDETLARIAGGMVGRSLVSVRTHTQVIGFFVNEADKSRADLFRDLKAETEATLESGLELLEARCASDEDWERALGPAEYVVQVAYDDYADALRGMGVDPKPVC